MSDGKIQVEEVTSVEAPPKARVESAGETFERKRDYLAGFLAQKPEPLSGSEPGGALYESVIEALKEIYDPEIPVNIYDLGLIYGVEVTEDGHAAVTMTLTVSCSSSQARSSSKLPTGRPAVLRPISPRVSWAMSVWASIRLSRPGASASSRQASARRAKIIRCDAAKLSAKRPPKWPRRRLNSSISAVPSFLCRAISEAWVVHIPPACLR